MSGNIEPARLSIFRNAHESKDVYTIDQPTALAIGERLVTAVGAYPAPANLMPEDVNLTQEEVVFSYSKPSPPNWHNSADHLIGLVVGAAGDGVALYSTIPAHSPDKVLAVEKAAGVPLQALPRHFNVAFNLPEQTLQAAQEMFQLPEVGAALVKASRRGTFAGLLNKIIEASGRIGRQNEEIIDFLQTNFPEAASEVAGILAQAETEDERPLAIGSALRDIAIINFANHRNDDDHKLLIEAASETLRALYNRPEWETSYNNYPYTLMFGAEWGHPMAVKCLYAPVAWAGKPIDPRITVTANVIVDGTYDLREHTFTPAERGMGPSGIEFVLKRGGISPAHTEAAIGDLLDNQMRVIGREYLSAEKMQNYLQDIQDATVEPLPVYPRDAPAPKVNVYRHPKKPPFPTGFSYR